MILRSNSEDKKIHLRKICGAENTTKVHVPLPLESLFLKNTTPLNPNMFEITVM
jgi:hypothetical protein